MKSIRPLILVLFLLLPLLTKAEVFHVSPAGSLSSLVGNSTNSISELTVTGELNGSDFKVIREMKKLATLDMSDARIVAGGDYYYTTYKCLANTIGTYLFAENTVIQKVFLPSTTTRIGEAAFSGCSNLQFVSIPNSVVSIDNFAFYYCSGLTSITLPTQLKYVDYFAFYGCKNVRSIKTGCNIPLRNGIPNFSEISDITILEGTKEICVSAFEGCSGLTQIDIPASVSVIRDHAFSGCDNLRSITLPDAVSAIEGYTFFKCRNLRSISIPEKLRSIGEFSFYGCENLTEFPLPVGLTKISPSLFYGCKKLNSINLPAGITAIGSNAFYDCSSLTTIDIPEGTTSIGSYAFHGCSRVTTLSIPSSVQTIEFMAFQECNSLQSIRTGCSFAMRKHIPGVESIADIRILGNPKKIAASAMKGCRAVTTVTIPESVTSIGDSAFADCAGVIDLTIPKGVKSIGRKAFSGCNRIELLRTGGSFVIADHIPGYRTLTDILILEGTQVIVPGAFRECAALTSIYFPPSVRTIGSRAFLNCTSISGELMLPEALLQISDSAFFNCRSLTAVQLPDGLTTVGERAFYKCEGLSSDLSIPESVNEIKNAAFYQCNGITSVKVAAIVPPRLEANNFMCKTVFVPLKSKQKYEEADFWKNNAIIDNELVVTVSVKTPGSLIRSILALGYEPVLVTQLTVSGMLNDIDFAAMKERMPLLSELDMSEALNKVLPEGALEGVSQLHRVTLPAGILSIEASAFNNCSALTGDLVLPEGLTEIGDAAFNGCLNVSDIRIPSTLRSMGRGAFAGCAKLQKLFVAQQTPVAIAEDLFQGVNYDLCRLYVPQQSTEAYLSLPVWKKFTVIGY